MTIKLETLRVYATVVDSGALAEAADRLGRTPSAVSMSLKQLERELDGRLFESDRKTKLTPLGRFVYDEAGRTLSSFDEMIAALRRFARGEEGLVRVAAVPSVATQLLPIVVERFQGARPRVAIEVRDIDSPSVLEAVRDGRVDVGLASSATAVGDLSCRTLMEERFGVLCRADHWLAGLDRPVDWSDLDPDDFIANGLCAQIAAPAFAPTVTGARLMVRNTSSLIAFVLQGFGTTILPSLAVTEIPAQLRFLSLKDPAAVRRILLLTLRRRAASPTVDAFVEEILAAAKSLRWQVSLTRP